METIIPTAEERTRNPYAMIPHAITFECDGRELVIVQKAMSRAAALACLALKGWDISKAVKVEAVTR